MLKDEHPMRERVRGMALLALLLCSGSLISGCVVLEEKYNAEKARSLNFQRLLAQEEKRTAELDSEVRRAKAELAEFEARNRELSSQVQMAREHMGRLQEETEAIREATVLERKALEDMQRKGHSPAAKQKKTGARKPGPSDVDRKDHDEDLPISADMKADAKLHVVKPGETLFSISRRYRIGMGKLKQMNNLPDDIIEVGQKLVLIAE
ncbi:MAG: LysM peptidoglycan-binding domain-containing protein [Nitrospira sp.]|nr:LysM peptidoglycan-binding domain-containing protein [Nitrospira sp.]MDH4369260.1 LysM peptidoglycan-binding domain-containing protein [Nitrospira sp.]MDH5496006.1 LysM peptidoglycan-binding domain-containing protein [Nitrospira sp.]MDH5724096.1 LysM peptidoglycan-binding domain-containing protein [Nitrospira sp.]